MAVTGDQSPDHEYEHHRTLTRLKWLTTILPSIAVFVFETIRHEVIGARLSTNIGDLLVGLLTLLIAYAFSEIVFGIVERLQAKAMARRTEISALNATMHERERVSRELHDGLAQVVAYLLMRIDTVASLVETNHREEALVELEKLRTAADDLYGDVRDSISSLRIQVTDRALKETLSNYMNEFEERHRIRAELQTTGGLEKLTPLAAYQVFRIVQESLANVRKHARAQRVWISTQVLSSTEMSVTISDDGCGFDPATVRGAGQQRFGLTTMRERAASLGGTLAIESQLGSGTRVVVTVPVGDSVRSASSSWLEARVDAQAGQMEVGDAPLAPTSR